MSRLLICTVFCSLVPVIFSRGCRFAADFTCDMFQSPEVVTKYLDEVMRWEGQFAQAGIAYDAASGYTYDGHPIDYTTGELYGEPHLFSAPSKESIHLGVLALAVSGNPQALLFAGGYDATMKLLQTKMNGYMAFNASYPGYGCFTPWVGFADGVFQPLESWSTPYYMVPGLDNGEWFWALYATAVALEERGEPLAEQYWDYVECQKRNAKMVFYRGDGNVSAVVNILDAFTAPSESNYIHNSGWLNDPYEGETMTLLIYLYSDFDTEEERDLLWVQKRDLLQAVNYTLPDGRDVTVQRGYWFSAHEQWKALLMPYISDDLPLVRDIFRNAERARTWDAVSNHQPGLLASINDVTDGSQNIPDYISATGIESIAFQEVTRRDVITPYGSYGLMLVDRPTGLCWYNNMLQAPRMQSAYGSTEAINVNGTEISPLTTWDSKITTVLAMLGGVGDLVATGMKKERDIHHGNVYHRFVHVVAREHEMVFGENFVGVDVDFQVPRDTVPLVLSDWKLQC